MKGRHEMPSPTGRAVAVLLCAGQGTRMGAPQNKVFLTLSGEPLLAFSTRAFVAAPSIDEVLFVAHPDEIGRVRREIANVYAAAKTRDVVSGGATRHQSEERALAALRPDIEARQVDVVLIHDAARPFVRPEDIESLVVAARSCRAALLASPVRKDEVIARIGPDGALLAALDSRELFRAQTPQAFEAGVLLTSFNQAQLDGYEGTDTASSVERVGQAIHVITGVDGNFKVTTPKDLLRAEASLRGALDSPHADNQQINTVS